MVKYDSYLWSVLVLLAMASQDAASPNIDISYQIGQLNGKLTDLQQKLDLFDSIADGDEIKVLKCADNAMLLKEINGTLNNLNSNVIKLNSLESKVDTLTNTVPNSILALQHGIEETLAKFAENIKHQMNENKEELENLADIVDIRLTTLENKFEALATSITSNVGKGSQNVQTSTEKASNAADKKASVDTSLGVLNKKFYASSCIGAFANPLLNRGDGLYVIKPNDNAAPFAVYCMADPKGGLPWTVVVRRSHGTTEFRRLLREYKTGFGDLSDDFFIGYDKLHTLTTDYGPQELWVMLTDAGGVTKNAYFDRFIIGTEAERYPLGEFGAFCGDADLSMEASFGRRRPFALWHGFRLNFRRRNGVYGIGAVWAIRPHTPK